MSASRVMFPAFALAMALVALPGTAAAQEGRPAIAVEVEAGTFLFPDDALVTEGFVGGAARFPLWRRVSVGPEIAYISGDNHSHLTLTGNMTVDLVGPRRDGTPKPVTPFVVVGGGLFQSRARAFNPRDSVYNEGVFTAGGGVRALVGTRGFVGAEARMGWEAHIRINAVVGVLLGR